MIAMSKTSSPKRRPLGHPPGTKNLPGASPRNWLGRRNGCPAAWLSIMSPPKILRREKPMSSGLSGAPGPLPANRTGSVMGLARRITLTTWASLARARPITGQPNRVGREIDLNQVGNEDRRQVGPSRWNRQLLAAADQQVDQFCQFRTLGVFAEDPVINIWQRAVVSVFVFQRDQPFTEERIALAPHLRK